MQPLWKSVWRFLKTPEIELLCDPAIPLLGPRSEDLISDHRDTCAPVFFAVPVTVARKWRPCRYPSADGRIMKSQCVCTTEGYADVMKNETMKYAGEWMELEKSMLSEVTQAPMYKPHI